MALISTDGIQCELVHLRPYPDVSSTDNSVTVQPVVSTDGKTTFDLSATLGTSLVVTKLPLYEYRYVWAEESSTTTANSAEWSFGNGAAGYIGLPIEDGWEIIQMGIHADTFPATAQLSVDAMVYPSANPGSSVANTVGTVSINGSTDGGGTTNNAFKIQNIPPVVIPTGVLGFITRVRVGNSGDSRVFVKLRKQIGEYVSEVN